MASKTYTAGDLFDRLVRHYGSVMSTAVVREASIGHTHQYEVGYRALADKGGETSVRRIDALILFRNKRWAVEIKVSLSDLKNELAKPEKQQLWAAHTNSFYFLLAPNLVEYGMANIPKEYGIMVADYDKPYVDWKGKTQYIRSPIAIARRAKVNSNPHDIPYTTLRRLGSAFMKADYERRAMKKEIARLNALLESKSQTLK